MVLHTHEILWSLAWPVPIHRFRTGDTLVWLTVAWSPCFSLCLMSLFPNTSSFVFHSTLPHLQSASNSIHNCTHNRKMLCNSCEISCTTGNILQGTMAIPACRICEGTVKNGWSCMDSHISCIPSQEPKMSLLPLLKTIDHLICWSTDMRYTSISREPAQKWALQLSYYHSAYINSISGCW